MKWRAGGKAIYAIEGDLIGVMKSVDLAHTVVDAHNDDTTFAQVITWIEEMDRDDQVNGALGRIGLWTAEEVIAYLQGRRRD